MEEVFEDHLKDVISNFQKDKIPRIDFRREGRVLSPFNSTFIDLMLKMDNPKSFEYLCPISLCTYKVISKVFARRLKLLLSTSISKEQFGFLDQR